MRCQLTEQDGFCVCANCGQKMPKSEFPCERHYAECKAVYLGDMVSAVTSALHIPECGGCKKRRQMLNELDQKVRGYFSGTATK